MGRQFESRAILFIKGVSLAGEVSLDLIEEQPEPDATFRQQSSERVGSRRKTGSGYFVADDPNAVPHLNLLDAEMVWSMQIENAGKQQTPSVRVDLTDTPGTLRVILLPSP